MLSLLLSAAILAGLSSSHNMGEQGIALAVAAEARRGAFGVEASNGLTMLLGWKR